MEAVLRKTQTQFQSKVAAELWLNIHSKEFRLVGKTIRLGRASDNDIVLEDKSVSRYHAILTILPDQIILEDLKSRNGTFVAGSKIKRAELKERAEIQIGDLPGLFYQKLKTGNTNPGKRILPKIEIEALAGLKDKFNQLDKKKKIYTVTGAVLGFFLLLKVLSGGGEASMAAVDAQKSLPTQAVVQKPVDRQALQRCVEFEDLGGFRQAYSCYKNLPFTPDIKQAMERVRERQEFFTEKRFTEGEQAFRNYYYDIAIQKWQEVLLIADDDSKYWNEASKGIQEAELRKNQR